MSLFRYLPKLPACGSIRRVFSSNQNVLQKSTFRRKNLSVKAAMPYGSVNLPFHATILSQMREDVLINPIFNGQVIFIKKSWLSMSPISEMLLNKLKVEIDKKEAAAVCRDMAFSTVSDKILVQLLTDLVHSQQMYQLDKLLPIIEAECCCRASNLDSASLLSIADAFYMMAYQFQAYLAVLMSQFELRWASLATTKQNILQLVFYVSYLRKGPIQLLHKIENFVNDNLDQFNGNEIGMLCHTFFVTNTSFRNYTLLVKISQSTLRELQNNDLRPYMLSNILKSFRHVHYLNLEFYDELGKCLPKVKHEKIYNTVSDYANIASTYSSLKVVNVELFAFINSALHKLLKEPSVLRKLRTKDLCRLIWSFGLLRETLDSDICRILVEKLRSDLNLVYKYPESFVEAMVALSLNEIYPSDLLDVLFSPNFLQIKSKRLLEQQYQLLLIEAAYKIEGQGCKTLHHSMFTSPIGNLDHDMSTRQGLVSLMKSLSKKLRDPANLWCHYILPHSTITDIEIRLDARNRPLAFNTKSRDTLGRFERKSNLQIYYGSSRDGVVQQLLDQCQQTSRIIPENIHMKPETSAHKRRITIKLMGWNQFAANKPMLLGVHQMELRLLTRLGYEVYVINPNEAQLLDTMNDDERTEYIDQLFRILDIDETNVRPTTRSALAETRHKLR